MVGDPQYMRRYRKANPEYVAEGQLQARARRKAHQRQAELDPITFHALLKEEVRKARAEAAREGRIQST